MVLDDENYDHVTGNDDLTGEKGGSQSRTDYEETYENTDLTDLDAPMSDGGNAMDNPDKKD